MYLTSEVFDVAQHRLFICRQLRNGIPHLRLHRWPQTDAQGHVARNGQALTPAIGGRGGRGGGCVRG